MIDSFKGKFAILSNFNGNIQGGKTVEHHYQAAKTTDWAYQIAILCAETPKDAKRLGRKAPLRSDWEQIKLFVMEELLRRKFLITENQSLLLSTIGHELVEGNYWHDNFWGVCNCGNCSNGQNHLGKLLMKIRGEMEFRF